MVRAHERTRMKEWYNSLEPRERKVMIGGAAVLAFAIFYFLLWEPLITKMSRLETGIQEQQELIAWMENAAQEVEQLQSKVKTLGSASKGQSLLGIIDSTAKRNRLKDAVKRVQPDGKTKARVRLENANFNDVIKWIETLQRRQGIRVESTVIEKQSEEGLVNARFVFVGAA